MMSSDPYDVIKSTISLRCGILHLGFAFSLFHYFRRKSEICRCNGNVKRGRETIKFSSRVGENLLNDRVNSLSSIVEKKPFGGRAMGRARHPRSKEVTLCGHFLFNQTLKCVITSCHRHANTRCLLTNDTVTEGKKY